MKGIQTFYNISNIFKGIQTFYKQFAKQNTVFMQSRLWRVTPFCVRLQSE